MPRELSERGKAFLKLKEGLRLWAYLDDAGIWTIGYGHTGPEVHEGLIWSQHEADAMFEREVGRFGSGVDKLVGDRELNQNQFDALVIFAYNIGLANFGHSGVLSSIRYGNIPGALHSWAQWNHVHDPKSGELVVSLGLSKRRQAEITLFQTPV